MANGGGNQRSFDRVRSTCLLALQFLVRINYKRFTMQRVKCQLEVFPDDPWQNNHDRRYATSIDCHTEQTISEIMKIMKLRNKKLSLVRGSALAVTLLTCAI